MWDFSGLAKVVLVIVVFWVIVAIGLGVLIGHWFA